MLIYKMMAEQGTKFRTNCGFPVRIYSTEDDNADNFIHGAVLLPESTYQSPGWVLTKWNPVTGANHNYLWSLEVLHLKRIK